MRKLDALKLLSEGNKKINKNILIWNLPAGDYLDKKTGEKVGTCGMNCSGCYAIKAQNFRPNVLKSRLNKYELSKKENFIYTVIDAIKKLDKKYVRIHESGDFYNQDYLNKWEFIAKLLPDITFLAYTKQIKKLNFSDIKKLPNVIIIDSLYNNKINFSKNISDGADYSTICPATLGTARGCGHDCFICYDIKNKTMLENKSIFFKQH